MDPFEVLWDEIDDPRVQVELATLYLTLRRDLAGIVLDRDALLDLMARRHRWPAERTARRLERLVELGLVARERGLGAGEVHRVVE